MKKRQKEAEAAYEAQWDGGKGSHHPDFDPEAVSRQGQCVKLLSAVLGQPCIAGTRDTSRCHAQPRMQRGGVTHSEQHPPCPWCPSVFLQAGASAEALPSLVRRWGMT